MNTPSALSKVVRLPTRTAPTPQVQRPLAGRGIEGLRDGMAEVLERIKRDARRWEVVAWARRTTHEAGANEPRGRPSPTRQMRALYAGLMREASFVRDPVDTEAVASTVQILCLDPSDECLHAGDCDEQLVALISSAVALGIPCRLRLRVYPERKQAHIMFDYDADLQLRGHWTCFDPSVAGGACSTAKFSQEIVMDVVMGREGEPGVFMGMGDPGPAPGEALALAYGQGDGTMGANGTTDAPAADAQGWVALLQRCKADLDASIARLQAMSAAYTQLRSDLGLSEFDPQGVLPSGETTAPGPLATYALTHAWTSDAQAAEQQLLQTAAFVSQCLADGLSGARSLYWNAGDLLVASKPGDPYLLQLVQNTTTGAYVLTFLDPSTQAQTGTMGLLPLLIVGAVIAVVSLAAAFAVGKWCDYQTTAHHDDALGRLSDQQTALVQSGAETPAQAQQFLAAATNFANAGPPSTKQSPSSTASTILLSVLFGVGGALLGYFAIPRLGAMLGSRGTGTRGAAAGDGASALVPA